MKELIFSNVLFGLVISILAFSFGTFVQKKTGKAFLNPLLISYVLIILFLLAFDIPYEWYQKGGDVLGLFLGPATCALALNIYRQWKMIKENFLALLAGTLAGCSSSMLMVYVMGKVLGLDEQITLSLMPKSVTTPMAMAVSESIGGIPALTVISVILTGVCGYILCPYLMKALKIKDPVEVGIAIGTCSHAVGTTKANELGELQGGLSSVSLTLSGIITVILSLIVFN